MLQGSVYGLQKRYFGEFSYGLELTYQITPQACISSKRSFVYHQGERGYSLRLMRYSPKRDDIPLLSQWIKKMFLDV